MISNVSLLDYLAGALPAGLKLRVYHLSTPRTPSSALFSAAPGLLEESTFCESHFLAIALPQRADESEEILVYAIEVLLFFTARLTTIFVSKADSSGFLHLLKAPSGSPSIIRAITTRFLEFIIDTRPKDSRLVLSLFARSQNQYLFPGSIENAEKHLLDDRQLIRWWCRTLDPIVRGQRPKDTGECPPSAIAHLLVPGCDKSETRAFFPATVKQDRADQAKWISSYPVEELTQRSSLPLRCLIPRLPDDPKARFLTELDAEHVNDQGQWRTIRSLDQFWEMLSYRQECSAGRLVGFVWVLFENLVASATNGHEAASFGAQEPLLPTPDHSQMANGAVATFPLNDAADLVPLALPESPPSSSSIQPTLHYNVAEIIPSIGSRKESELLDTVDDKKVGGAEECRGEVIISADDYEGLMEYLLQLDFAGQNQATEDTKKWIAKAADFAHAKSWGKDLEGRCTVPPPARASAMLNSQLVGVNVLMGLRKKRKAEEVSAGLQKTPVADSAANETLASVLPSGLIRKKPKT